MTTRKKHVFTNLDYSSNDGMLTSVWGPSMWHFLHTMSFNYPVNPSNQDKIYYMDFIKKLEYILPCKHCRMNLKKNFKIHPITSKTMENRLSFSKYIYELHEIINGMLHKKSNLSYEDVRETYEHFRSRCTTQKTQKNHETGCIKPLHGEKSKCILRIVPNRVKTKSFHVDKKCFKRRLNTKRRKIV